VEKLLLENLSWIEVNKALGNGINTIFIVVGAIEQHGLYLPLSTKGFLSPAFKGLKIHF